MENKYEMFVENKKTISEHSSVRLLGIKIDNQLNFENHVSTLCKKKNRFPAKCYWQT